MFYVVIELLSAAMETYSEQAKSFHSASVSGARLTTKGPIADIRKRDYHLTMSGKVTAFLAGVLLASLFWIVLAQQSYCAGSFADWLKMGDVEECR